jgi:molecular chaperone DnaK
MYNAQNAQGGQQAGPQDFDGQQQQSQSGNQQGDVTDVDFEEVK